MTEYGTIKIPKEEYDRHNAKRKNLGETWAEYINGQAPDAAGGIDVEDARLLSQHLERAIAPYFADLVGVDDASEIRGALDVDNNDMDAEELAREVARQLDYAMLADKVAESVLREVQG